MLVVVANNLKPAVRGRMKLWFVEPKPNVFVTGCNDSVALGIIKYLVKHCPPESGVMIYRSQPAAPGYEIITIGPTKKDIQEISGLQLVVETRERS